MEHDRGLIEEWSFIMKKICCLLALLLFSLLAACENNKINGNIDTSPNLSTVNNEIDDDRLNDPINSSEDENITEQIDCNKDLQTAKGKDIDSLIPCGWSILEDFNGELVKAEGDLNKDGITDIAVVIENTEEDEEAPPRALLIAFGNNDGTFSLSIISDKVILKRDEGGVWGDPFESLSIDRGSVLVSDYGGSNWRWYNKYRFRFQDDDWYLIGATTGSYYSAETTRDHADEEDINLLTGDYILRTTDENGKVKIIKGNRGKKKLIKLSDFNIEDM